MIATILEELGPWLWWILGMALFAGEIILPSLLMFWIGLAAFVIGAAALMAGDSALWSWPIQLAAFIPLAAIAAAYGRRRGSG